MLPLIQLIDSSFPTGAFSHSFGLETALQEGRIRNTQDLYGWLCSYVTGSLAPMEGVTVYWVHTYIKEGIEKHSEDLKGLDHRVTLSRLARESREGGIKVGKRYLRIVLDLYPESEIIRYLDWIKKNECYGCVSLVHGWVCAYLKQSAQHAVASHLYASINSLIQNALRAMAMGQTQGQKVLTRILPLLEQEAMLIVKNPISPEDLASHTLSQEISAMRHECLYSRLFMS